MDTDALITELVALAGTLEDGNPRDVIAACQRVAEQAAAVRDEAALKMVRAGATLAETGQALGVSRQRVHQLLTRGHRRAWGQTVIPEQRDPRGAFSDYCHAELEQAEAACKGYLVTRTAENHRIDGRAFYAAHGRRLHPKWASDELLEHWETHGRPLTWTAWQAQTRESNPV